MPFIADLIFMEEVFAPLIQICIVRLRVCNREHPRTACLHWILSNICCAGIAAVPLTDAMLGWPLALAFLLLMAFTTYASLNILVRHALCFSSV